jgi:hypothetical protein
MVVSLRFGDGKAHRDDVKEWRVHGLSPGLILRSRAKRGVSKDGNDGAALSFETRARARSSR